MTRSDAILPALTPKQWRFIDEYLIDLNATQAAIRAGYSARTANQQGPRLLEHPGIADAINAAKLERADKLEVDADFVLQRLVEEANADLADLYTVAGDLKPVDEWPEVWRRGLVAGVEIDALYEGTGKNRTHVGYTKKLRLSDRVRRLELIGKHIKVNAFQDRIEIDSADGWAERLIRAKARASERANVVPAIPAPVLPPPVAPPAPVTPPPVAPRPKPYRPIMPAPEPVTWLSTSGQAVTDYDPTASE